MVRGADHQDMKERRRKASKPMDLSHEVLRIHCFARRQIRETRRRGSSKAVGRTIVYRRKFHRIPPGQASSLCCIYDLVPITRVCLSSTGTHHYLYDSPCPWVPGYTVRFTGFVHCRSGSLCTKSLMLFQFS